MSLRFEETDLVAEVKDRGRGFETSLLDLKSKPDLNAPGGRGLFLMEQLMDDLAVRCDGGAEIRAVKRRALSESTGRDSAASWALPGRPSCRTPR